MTRTRPAGPVVAPVRVVRSGPAAGSLWEAAVTVPIGAQEPVFPGHYPGFPIFPGVCVIECVHLSGLEAPPPGVAGLELAAVETARFLSPVFPDDELDVRLRWSGGSGAWTCAAEVATDRGPAARVRLRFTGEAAA